MRIAITVEEDEYGDDQILINGESSLWTESFDELMQEIGRAMKDELGRIGYEGVVIEVTKEKVNV